MGNYDTVKRWRERHPEKRKIENREYARKRRANMTDEEKAKLKEYNARKQREHRARVRGLSF